MLILNFHFMTIHCYGFTDNDEVNSNLCSEVLNGSLYSSEKVVKAEMG